MPKALVTWILIFIFLLPLISFKGNATSPFEFPKLVFATFSVAALFLAYLFIRLKNAAIEFRFHKVLGFSFLFLVSSLISYVPSVNHYLSFWGDKQLPADSMLTYLIFFLFSFLILQIFDLAFELKKLSLVLIGVVTVQIVCGLIQIFNIDLPWWGFHNLTFGTQGQTVAFASLLGCLASFVVVNFFSIQSKLLASAYGLILFLLNFTILHTGARTPVVVLWGTFAVLTIYFTFHKHVYHSGKKLFVFVLLIVLSTALFKYTNNSSEIETKANPVLIKKGFFTRALLAESGIEAWKAKPVFGHGPQLFTIAQRPHQKKEMNLFEHWQVGWTKAHNFLVDVLVNQGVAGILLTLFIYFYLAVKAAKLFFKKASSENDLISLACFTGFNFLFLSNMTAFNMVPTQMFYTMFPILFVLAQNECKTLTFSLRPSIRMVVLLVGIFAFSTLLWRTYAVWKSDVIIHSWTNNEVMRTDKIKSLDLTIKAIEINPVDPLYYCFAGQLYTEMLSRNSKSLKADDIQKALNEIDSNMRQCRELGPGMDFYIGLTAEVYAELYYQKVVSSPEKSLFYYGEIQKMVPYNPKTLLEIGRLHLQAGKEEDFIAKMNESLALKADYVPAYIELINYYYKNQKIDDVINLTDRLAKVNFLSEEFVHFIPDLVTIAKNNGDLRSEEIFRNSYEKFKYLIPVRQF